MASEKSDIPVHVSIIPDGNRRWAKAKGLAASEGHMKAGIYENVMGLVREAKKIGCKCLSAWGFSTENWKRSAAERKVLFDIFHNLVRKAGKDLHEEKIKFLHIGRRDRLSKDLIKDIEKLEEETENYSDFTLVFCLDYGGRDEIVRAVNKILKSGKREISEEQFPGYLDSAGLPDPDLIIRTGGEQRLSGFMPFQSVYAELYFTDAYFPDFDAKELRKAIEEFGRRQRRFGGN